MVQFDRKARGGAGLDQGPGRCPRRRQADRPSTSRPTPAPRSATSSARRCAPATRESGPASRPPRPPDRTRACSPARVFCWASGLPPPDARPASWIGAQRQLRQEQERHQPPAPPTPVPSGEGGGDGVRGRARPAAACDSWRQGGEGGACAPSAGMPSAPSGGRPQPSQARMAPAPVIAHQRRRASGRRPAAAVRGAAMRASAGRSARRWSCCGITRPRPSRGSDASPARSRSSALRRRRPPQASTAKAMRRQRPGPTSCAGL